ncbi:MAG TPA: Lrp/AsnC family transcriptional regulator [Thermococcus sp.]|nr:Lrp/AsnC ligand binding domain-containing protein [Thermoplasmata archaeon]RLF34956.1 MAG: hypothetical protein DRN03_05995 [Thermoplasmata archaeon]RLF39927.1 MAG: hypothetical protein DRN00_00700 [Thermoplasmata archaeon]HDH45173.1 Lrp/AsnC family transcriptional regulator [Thermococcus sp.]
MIKAYILVKTRVGKLEKVLQKARELKNVESIAVVTGDCDLIVKVKVRDTEQLLQLTDELQTIDGIRQTTTHVIEKEITL